jgi:hypothetical protein
MKTYGGVDVWIHSFLTSVLTGGEWSASLPCRVTHEESASVTHSKLGGPQSLSGRRGKEKITDLTDSNSDLSLVQPVVSSYTDCTIPTRAILNIATTTNKNDKNNNNNNEHMKVSLFLISTGLKRTYRRVEL